MHTYTPDFETVRQHYADARSTDLVSRVSREEALAEFDRWHQAEVDRIAEENSDL